MATKDDINALKDEIAAANVTIENQNTTLGTVVTGLTKVLGETKANKASIEALTTRIAELEAIIANGSDPEIAAAIEAAKAEAAKLKTNLGVQQTSLEGVLSGVTAVDSENPDTNPTG